MKADGTNPQLTPIEIARLEERRQAIATNDIAQESEPVGGGWMTYAGKGSWANQACAMGLDGPVGERDLDRLVEFYCSRGVEPRVELCPFVDPTLTQGLARRGFVLKEFENVLTRSLTAGEDLRAQHPFPWPSAVMERVDREDDAQVEDHVRVSVSGFVEDPTPDMLESARRATVHPRAHGFNATVDGIVVGAGAMEASAEIATLFGTTVVPEYRRRGIQLALILERLTQARDLGCRIACIHSRPGIATERNATRAGFALTYTKVILVRPGDGLDSSL